MDGHGLLKATKSKKYNLVFNLTKILVKWRDIKNCSNYEKIYSYMHAKPQSLNIMHPALQEMTTSINNITLYFTAFTISHRISDYVKVLISCYLG